MIRVLVLIGLAVLLFIFFRWLSNQPRRVFWQSVAGLVAVVLLLLVATGRAHWLAAVFAALIPLFRGLLSLLHHIPLIQRLLASAKAAQSANAPSTDQTSTVQSRYISMTLNHDSGEINGEVLAGQFKGRSLDQMQLEELLELLRECQDDEESVALLQAYLDRNYADTWQERAGGQGRQQSSDEPGKLSREEALEILGLSANPTEQEIVQAHRRLMQHLHPDRGGSAYLAAKINLAKETLLAK